MIFKENMILQSITNGIKCKVIFVDQVNNIINIEYLNPPTKNYDGLHSYPLKSFLPEWVHIGDDIETPSTEIKSQFFKENYLKQCDHKWQKYQGLKDTFDFCIKCDQKRDKK